MGYGHRRAVRSLRFTRARETAVVKPGGPIFANNGDIMVPMLVAGQGVADLPEFIIADALADGRLVRLLSDWDLPPLRLQIVMPPSRRRPARVNALVDHLAMALKASCGGDKAGSDPH
jgi:DNA-binding transcriptional LysR family regulator